MSREIKFRAWNKVKNTMHPFINSKENWSFSFLDKDVFIWLQWTGLYDLYEDDIIELENWNPSMYVIKFIEGAFCLADLKTGEYVADIHYIHHAGKPQYKTVSNIHETRINIPKR